MQLTMSVISSLAYPILVLLSGYCTFHFCRDVIMRAGNSSNWRMPMEERHGLLFSSYIILVLLGFGFVIDATIHAIFELAPEMLAKLVSPHAHEYNGEFISALQSADIDNKVILAIAMFGSIVTLGFMGESAKRHADKEKLLGDIAQQLETCLQRANIT